MRVDTWGYEIISSQDYLVGKCLVNGRHNMVEQNVAGGLQSSDLTCNAN